MERVVPRVLKGFRDYLPEMMGRRSQMLTTASGVFERFGFAPLATPALEYTDILLGKYGDEGDKLLYRFEDNGGRDVSLRYDLTVPLARVVAQHTQLPRPFKRYQIAPVWRAEKPGKGRFREFVQCDVDIVGTDSTLADFECIQVGVDLLKSLGVEDFELRINDRRILDGLLALLNVRDRTEQLTALRAVDKLPKIGWDGVRAELNQTTNLNADQLDTLSAFLTADLHDVDESMVDMDVAGDGIAHMSQLMDWADDLGIGGYVKTDLSIARGLDYYTSTIYETFLTKMPDLGSVMSGGRYDDLLTMFSKNTVPAVGISMGVDRLLVGLTELGLTSDADVGPQIYITVFSEETISPSQRFAAKLRNAGFRVQVHLQPGQKLGRQFKAADRCGASFVVVAGPEECAKGEVTVKDLSKREQVTVGEEEAVGWIEQRV
jgi:histidyl-tRNA synthetase